MTKQSLTVQTQVEMKTMGHNDYAPAISVTMTEGWAALPGIVRGKTVTVTIEWDDE